MNPVCDICQGRRVVVLPVRCSKRAASAAFEGEIVPRISQREYPCPECCDVAAIGQVGALHEDARVRSDIVEPSFLEYIKEQLAYAIGFQLLRSGYISFRRGRMDEDDLSLPMRATVAVVHPSKLGTLERRIAERQAEVAKEAADEAIRKIDNWGSSYGRSEILKRDAQRFVAEAVDAVVKRRAHS